MNLDVLRHMLLLCSSDSWNSAALFLVFLLSAATDGGADFFVNLSTHTALPSLDSASVIQAREQQERRFQQAAFETFDRHKTGEIYSVSSSRSAVIQAVRLRSGGLRKYGLHFNEFEILRGCRVESPAERVLLVYERLSASDLFPVNGYEVAGPVVGISVYDASDLRINVHSLPMLRVQPTFNDSIRIHLRAFPKAPEASPFCAYFEGKSLNVVIRNVSSTGVCHVSELGFFSLVARRPFPPLLPPASPNAASAGRRGHQKSRTLGILIGSVIGALGLLACIAAAAFMGMKHRRQKDLVLMESRLDLGEALQTAFVKNSRTPAAASTRTQPVLEGEYVSHI